jgi:hypothetical protein
VGGEGSANKRVRRKGGGEGIFTGDAEHLGRVRKGGRHGG